MLIPKGIDIQKKKKAPNGTQSNLTSIVICRDFFAFSKE